MEIELFLYLAKDYQRKKNGLKKAFKQIEKTSKGKSMTWLEIERDNEVIDIEYENDYVCPYNIYLDRDKKFNAYASGEEIIITKGALEELKDDKDKLASIIGHELAHNTLGHSHSKKKNRFLGLILGAIIDFNNDRDPFDKDIMSNQLFIAGHNMFSQEFEKEADYLGTYYMARAGYNYHRAKTIWKTLTIHNPNSLYLATTHPTNGERYTIIDKTAEEIDNKKAFEMEITPNWRKRNDYIKNKDKGFFYW